MKTILRSFCLFFCLVALTGSLVTGCRTTEPRLTVPTPPLTQNVDYSNPENWIIRSKINPKEREVDVFYVYPTIVSDRKHPTMTWDSPKIRRKAKMIAEQQTGCFYSVGRIYAPYYRQEEYTRAIAGLQKNPMDISGIRPGLEDIRNAFRYYLEHDNNGRPFLLFGHSQGAMVLLELMKTEFKNPKLQNQLVAAYLIGCPKMPKFFPEFPHLKLAKGRYDTGVIVGYNSESPDAVPSVFTGKGDYYCINPLNWRTDQVPADASLHEGAVFFRGRKSLAMEEKNFCTAVVDPAKGALIVVPQKKGRYDSKLMGKGVYHMNDVYFFYRNLEKNARERVGAFWK